MRYDFSPLYRSTVGFDQMFEALDRFSQSDSSPGWPAYDIERMDEDFYRIFPRSRRLYCRGSRAGSKRK
jgi:molecular chaperone IbpA